MFSRTMRPIVLACLLVLACTLIEVSEAKTHHRHRHGVGRSAQAGALKSRHSTKKAAVAVAARELEGGEEPAEKFEETTDAEPEGAEGEEFKEGEEGEEEEEEFNEADIQVSCMLLGAVSFVLMLMWLVNYSDDDVRRYAWRIISATMSIFAAVMFFVGNNQLLDKHVEHFSEMNKVLIHFGHCLIYLIGLGFAIIFISGSAQESDTADLDLESWVVADSMLKDFDQEVKSDQVRAVINGQQGATKSVFKDKHGMEVTVHLKKVELDKRKKAMRCYGTLLAHCGGFAAIEAGGSLQHLAFFKQTPATTLLAVVLTQIWLLTVFWILQKIRHKLNSLRPVTGGRKGTRAKLTKEEVVDSENDVSSLAMSFLIVQACRYQITGTLPNEEGLDPHGWEPEQWQIGALYASGVGFACLGIVLVMMMARKGSHSGELAATAGEGEAHGAHEEHEHSPMDRVYSMLINGCAMCFSWCLFWGTKWFFIHTPMIDVETLFGTVVMALTLSVLTCLVVIFLDQIEDSLKGNAKEGVQVNEETSKVVQQAIQSIITSFGILVGFAWEHCFDEGVAAVASQAEHKVTTKFILGVCCVAFLLPMWKSYILSKAMQLEELKEMRQAAEERMNATTQLSETSETKNLITSSAS